MNKSGGRSQLLFWHHQWSQIIDYGPRPRHFLPIAVWVNWEHDARQEHITRGWDQSDPLTRFWPSRFYLLITLMLLIMCLIRWLREVVALNTEGSALILLLFNPRSAQGICHTIKKIGCCFLNNLMVDILSPIEATSLVRLRVGVGTYTIKVTSSEVIHQLYNTKYPSFNKHQTFTSRDLFKLCYLQQRWQEQLQCLESLSTRNPIRRMEDYNLHLRAPRVCV